MSYATVSKEYKCPVCGRRFFVPYSTRLGGENEWAFKIRVGNKIIYLCRYSCTNKAKEELAKVNKAAKARKKVAI